MSTELLETQAVVPLEEMFPEAKLTMKDRLPMNFILTNALITIQKSILNIQYSSEEIKEAVQGFVAMIPDDLKDEAFNTEIESARQYIVEDTRPQFCGIPASPEYCQRKGIPMTSGRRHTWARRNESKKRSTGVHRSSLHGWITESVM